MDKASPAASGQASRNLESPPEADPATRALAAREIRLRVGSGGENRADVHVLERAGRVHVAVRTPNTELTSSLREHLGSLVTRMEQRGYHSETWTPTDGRIRIPAPPWDVDSGPNASLGQSPSDERGSAGDQPGGQERQQQDRPGWLRELERSFGDARDIDREEAEWIHLSRH